jgi:hypothetical protein
MMVYKISDPVIQEVNHLQPTSHGGAGFVSTGIGQPASINETSDSGHPNLEPSLTPTVHRTVVATCTTIRETDGIKPYNIWFRPDPFQNKLNIQVQIKGDHPSLGFILHPTQHTHRMQLTDIMKGTPTSKIPKWRSTLKRAILLSFNGKPIISQETLQQEVLHACQQGLLQATCEFATVSRHAQHPQEGSLMLHYDQLNVIAKHLKEAYQRPMVHQLNANEPASTNKDSELGKFFTLKQIKKRPDWPEWR